MFGKRLRGGLYRAADASGTGGGDGAGADAEGEPVQGTGEGLGEGAGQVSEPGADGWTLERALAEIKNLRGEAAKYRKAKTEAERAAQVAAEAQLADEKRFAELADMRAKERDDALAKLQEMERQVWRQKAAQAAGLAPELAERIRGEDEAGMMADARALAKLMPSAGGAPPGPQRSGAAPEEDAARLAQVRQRFRL
jgi:hypothetical protein